MAYNLKTYLPNEDTASTLNSWIGRSILSVQIVCDWAAGHDGYVWSNSPVRVINGFR